MTNRKVHRAGIMLLVTGLVACSGPMVRTDYNRSVSFDGLKTYAWGLDANPTGAKLSEDRVLDSRVRAAVDTVMQGKGFKPVSTQDADLLLQYEASAEEKVDASHIDNYDTAAFMGLTYTLGTLKLNMKRQGSTEVAWQGTVQANIDQTQPLEERDKKLQDAIVSLLKKFPPK